ncbi:MFS transporter [Streptomyces antimycoticus]|uniref:MFS transporter n=1 Tax=Streptomyces antimycoticus TaxID=68175 RepID=UPI0036BF830F
MSNGATLRNGASGATTPPFATRRWALLAMSVGVFCIQLDSFGLNLALPQIGRDLHAGGDGLQWVISAYLLSTGTLMLGAGRLGDLFGRRRLLVAGLAVFGASSLVCALAPTLPALVGARVAQGAGAAMIMPVGLSLLTNVYPAELRGRATGWALGIGGIATACGPFIGGALTESVSWRAVFWLNVPLAVLGAVCASRTAESYDTSAPRSVDWGGLAGATAALAALCVVIDRGPRWPWPVALAGVAVAVALLILFVRRERAAAHPLVELSLFHNGPYMALTLAGAAANTATVMFLFVVPLTLQGQWNLSVVLAGTAFLAPALAMALAGPLAGRVPPRAAARLMAGCLCGGGAGSGVPRPDLLPHLVFGCGHCGRRGPRSGQLTDAHRHPGGDPAGTGRGGVGSHQDGHYRGRRPRRRTGRGRHRPRQRRGFGNGRRHGTADHRIGLSRCVCGTRHVDQAAGGHGAGRVGGIGGMTQFLGRYVAEPSPNRGPARSSRGVSRNRAESAVRCHMS